MRTIAFLCSVKMSVLLDIYLYMHKGDLYAQVDAWRIPLGTAVKSDDWLTSFAFSKAVQLISEYDSLSRGMLATSR